MNKASLLLHEILSGESVLICGKDKFFFKHPSIFFHLSQERNVEKIKERGEKNGLLSEEELIKNAIDSDCWSKENEAEIEDLVWVIDKKHKAFAKISDPNLKKNNEAGLKEDQKRLEELLSERSKITDYSLEKFVSIKSSFSTCIENIFVDENLTENISKEQAEICFPQYMNKCIQMNTRDDVLKAAFCPDFFDLFFLFEGSTYNVLGKNIYDLTIFQKTLILYAFILRNKLKEADLPDKVREDPVALYGYENKNKDGQEKESENFNTRNFVKGKGGIEKMKAEDKL